MYQRYFGLTQAPFSIAPDPRHLFLGPRHREALAHLLYGLQGSGGFVLLSGGIGTGKTTLIQCFLAQVPATTHVAYIFNPALSVPELLRTVCDEFGVALPPGSNRESVKDHIDPLNTFLLGAHAAGRQAVLVIDEAQNLSPGVLEQLRLLTNLETHERKLLQIVLVGQPELRDMLRRPELEQLAQRVIARYHLRALNESECSQYVQHRLAVAGRQGPSLFDAKALQRLYQLSAGVPRRVNLLADRALLGAYAAGLAQVTARLVSQASQEVTGEAPSRPPWRPWVAIGVLAVAAGTAGWAHWSGRWGAWGSLAATTQDRVSEAAAASAAAAASTGDVLARGLDLSGTATEPTDPAATPAWQWVTGWPVGDESSAWQSLAPFWGATVREEGALCAAVDDQGQALGCYRGRTALSTIQLLDRPGVLSLKVDGDGVATAKRQRYALLLGVDDRRVLLGLGSQRRLISRAELAAVWNGEFATFWRTPPAYTRPLGEGAQGPAVDYLAQTLARLEGRALPPPGSVLTGALKAKVEAFQRAQGLPSQGSAGAQTFMLLQRAADVVEPHLQTMPPAEAPASLSTDPRGGH